MGRSHSSKGILPVVSFAGTRSNLRLAWQQYDPPRRVICCRQTLFFLSSNGQDARATTYHGPLSRSAGR